MKKLTLIIAILILSNINAQEKSSENDKLVTCLKQEKFLLWYNICRTKKDTVVIYNNTSHFNHFKSIKTSCNTILALQKSSIEIDVNKIHPNCESTIVLHQYEVKNGIYKLVFLDTCSNAQMIIELNSKNKIIHCSKGVF